MRKEFEHVRGDVDKFAEQCFNHACRMGKTVQIDLASSPGRLGDGPRGGEKTAWYTLSAHASKCTQNPGTP